MQKEDKIEGSVQSFIKKSNKNLAIIIVIILILLIVASILGYLAYTYLKSKPPEMNKTGEETPVIPNQTTTLPNQTSPTNITTNQTQKTSQQGGGGESGETTPCIPNCAGKQCGNNECGGSCGSCNTGYECNSTFGCSLIPCTNDTGCNIKGQFCSGNIPYNCTDTDEDICLERINLTKCVTGWQCINGTGCVEIPQCNVDSDCNNLDNTCSYGICNSTGRCEISYNSTSDLCRPAVGECDLEEKCTGDSAACPTNVLNTSTTICRPAVGECDITENCSGSNAACPTNVFQPDGTACSVGVCSNGKCAGGTNVTFQQLKDDITLPHELSPLPIIPTTWGWSYHGYPWGSSCGPRSFQDDGRDYYNPWGQIFPDPSTPENLNAGFELGKITFYIKLKSTGQWYIYEHGELNDGYIFYGESALPEVPGTYYSPIRGPGGGLFYKLGMGNWKQGTGLHNWPSHAHEWIDNPDVEHVAVSITARITLQDPNGVDDRDNAKYLIGIGVDHRWQSGNGPIIQGVLMSRHRYLTNEWQTFTAHTICPDMVEIERPPIHGATWLTAGYSISPFSKIWNLIKEFFTGNTIKEITGYFLRIKA